MSTLKFLFHSLQTSAPQYNRMKTLRVTIRTFSTPNSRSTTGGGGGSLYPTTREKNFKNDAFNSHYRQHCRIVYANTFERVLSTGFQRVRRTRTSLRASINKHETSVYAPTTTGLGRPFQTNYRSMRSDFYNFLLEHGRLFDPFSRVGERYWNGA